MDSTIKKIQIRNILLDIRFWLLFFFALRLFGITNAPLEVTHNWRQALTDMIARNFLQHSANILHPTIDMAGANSGIIGAEFPFYNYLIYLCDLIFGYSHWIGRLINLIVSSFGMFYFYKIIKNIVNKQVAFNATIILAVSVWFAFSRKIMPDTFSVALVIIGLYHAYKFIKTGFSLNLIWFFIFSTLGILCKIPALSLFSVLFILVFIKEVKWGRKVKLFLTAGLTFFIVCMWYFYWVPHLLATYHYQLYFPKGFIEGMMEIKPLIPQLLEKFYFSALRSYIAFACFIVGVVLLVKSKDKYLKYGIGVITLFFFLFILKTGAVFPLHGYYIIPFVPVMALIAGYAIERIPLKFQYILLGLIVFEGVANQQHDFFIKKDQLYKLELGNITKKLIPPKNLIVINGGHSPEDIYYADKKGWSVNNSDITNTKFMDSVFNLGAKYLIVDKSYIEDYVSPYKAVFNDKHYGIYKLKKVKREDFTKNRSN